MTSTNNLIERLKYFSGWSTRDVPFVEMSATSILCWDAIDEIERLRKLARDTERELENILVSVYGMKPEKITNPTLVALRAINQQSTAEK